MNIYTQAVPIALRDANNSKVLFVSSLQESSSPPVLLSYRTG